MKRYSIKIFAFFSSLLIFLVFGVTNAMAATRIWDGGGGDNNWSTCANWDGPDTCPIAGDTATFNATSTKASTIDAGFGSSIAVININAGYSGTITVATTLDVSSTFTQSAGTFNISNQLVSFSSTLTLNAGSTFIASSATTTINKTFTVNGGSFNANGGTVAFAGGGATLTCNNITFNAVTFTGQTGAKVIGATCNLPLGANPSIPLAITLNGTLNGTGTLTLVSGTSTFNTGGTLTGFTGLSVSALGVTGGNFGSVTTFASSGTLTVSGTWNAGSISSFTTNGSFIFNTGAAFTAPTGTMTVNSTFTVNDGTFTANSGTVAFAGSTATLTCNNITFNLVSFAGQTGTKTVANTCTLPLGNNATIPNSITLTGTLSGTGSLIFTTGTLTMNTGSAITGFTTLNPSALTVSSGNFGSVINLTAAGAISITGTFDASAFTTFIANGTMTLNSGAIFSGPSGLTTNNTFTMNTGSTFTASSGTTFITQTFTINGGTFNANGGTINFAGGGSTLTCNNITFNSVSFAGQTGTKSVTSTCSLPLGSNPTIPNSITLAGTLSGSGALTFSSGTLTMNASSSITGFDSVVTNALTFNGGGFGSASSLTANGSISMAGTLDASAFTTFDANSNLTFNTGAVFTAPTGTMSVGGNLTYTAGTFTANGGTVSLDGSDQTVAGAFTFYNLTKNISSAATLTFPASTITTVTNTLTLGGSSSAYLELRSSSDLTAWSLDAQGSRVLSYLDVKDSNNISGVTVNAGTGSFGTGSNNTDWFFPPPIVTNNTYYVSTTGNDGSDGSLATPFLTITYAISVVNAGDTIRILPGTYTENIVMSNRHGVSGNPIRIVGDSLDPNSYPIISGNDPDYLHINDSNYIGFRLTNCSWISFERMRLQDASDSIFKIDSSHYIVVRRNILAMHKYGLLLGAKSSHVLMEYNEAYQTYPDGSTWTDLKSGKWEGGAFTSFAGAGMNVIRYNFFHDVFNAIYTSTNAGFLNNAADANIWIYRNRFEDVVDDPFEPESYSYNNHFFYNTLIDTHRLISLAPNASGLLGPIYIYENVQYTPNDPSGEAGSGRKNSAIKLDLSTSNYSNGVMFFNNSVDMSQPGTNGYGIDKLTSQATAINNFTHYNNAYQTLHDTISQSTLVLTNSDIDYDMSQTSFGYTEPNGFPNTAPGFSDLLNEDFRLATALSPAVGKSRAITASIGFASSSIIPAGADLGAYQFGEDDFRVVPEPIYAIPPGGEDPSFPANEAWASDTEGGANPLSAPFFTTIASPTPTPTSTPTPAPTEAPVVTSSNNNSSSPKASDARCSDSVSIPKIPDLFELRSNNRTSTLFIAPPPMPYTHFVVAYSKNPDSWEHSAQFNHGQSGGVIKFDVNYLNPNTTYYFRIKAANDCKEGEWSQTIRIATSNNPKTIKTNYKSSIIFKTKTVQGKINSKVKKAIDSMLPGKKPLLTPRAPINESPKQIESENREETKPQIPEATNKKKFCILWWCF